MHVGVYRLRGLGGVEGLCEEGAEDGEPVGVFVLHGGFHVFSIGGIDQSEFGMEEGGACLILRSIGGAVVVLVA